MRALRVVPDGTTASVDREALVHAARHLALQRDDVVRLTEALTGRPWADCGTEEVALVVQHLRELVRRSIAGGIDR